MILVVFHTAGINEKKNIIIMKKKKFGTEPGWAIAQVSLRLGRARGARALGAAGMGARSVGESARGAGAGRRAAGRPGRAGRAQQGRGRHAAWALGARAGQECALGAPDLIFKPIVRLGIFPELVNEHCSL